MRSLPTPACLSPPSTKAALADRFGAGRELVDAGELGAILGRPAKSILGAVRAGSFPIAHRKLGRAIMFKLGDVAAWLDAGPPEDAPLKPRETDELGAPRFEILPIDLVASIARHAAAPARDSPQERAARAMRHASEAVERRRGRTPP